MKTIVKLALLSLFAAAPAVAGDDWRNRWGGGDRDWDYVHGRLVSACNHRANDRRLKGHDRRAYVQWCTERGRRHVRDEWRDHDRRYRDWRPGRYGRDWRHDYDRRYGRDWREDLLRDFIYRDIRRDDRYWQDQLFRELIYGAGLVSPYYGYDPYEWRSGFVIRDDD